MPAKIDSLLTNDDGIHADGIEALIVGLDDLIDPLVVAPLCEKSGASSSITLGRDIHLVEKGDQLFAFDGTPVDCVAFALRNLVREKPALCISGINLGENLGNDTICSGTVGGALAAAAEGIPAIAISMQGRKGPFHFTSAIKVLRKIIVNHERIFTKLGTVALNINIPNKPFENIRGIKLCQLGQRVWSEEFLPGEEPGSFRYNHADPINFGGIGKDVTELADGFVTVSVLRPSLECQSGRESLANDFSNWFKI